MTTLIEFLRARLDEDETSVTGGECRCEDGKALRPDCPDRVLAEVDAKRRIITEWTDVHANEEPGDRCDPVAGPSEFVAYETHGGHADAMSVVLPLLALPYSDHPDYDQNWRPE